MDRTNTKSQASFTLPDPDVATFEFVAQHQIRVTVPASSTWITANHWHSPEQENCLLLHPEQGEIHVSTWRGPRVGADITGPGDFRFRPESWTYWKCRSSPRDPHEENTVLFVVRDASLYRNTCSATLDAERFPYLNTTPFWLRGVFATLSMFPAARQWLVRLMLYVQLQTIYYKYGYWQYHGGINALSWWQAIFTWNIGEHPRWTVPLESRSQKIFSKVVQGAYSWMGKSLFGMKADYPQYNPRFSQDSSLRNVPSLASFTSKEEILKWAAAPSEKGNL